jgi:hypothetical protein
MGVDIGEVVAKRPRVLDDTDDGPADAAEGSADAERVGFLGGSRTWSRRERQRQDGGPADGFQASHRIAPFDWPAIP